MFQVPLAESVNASKVVFRDQLCLAIFKPCDIFPGPVNRIGIKGIIRNVQLWFTPRKWILNVVVENLADAHGMVAMFHELLSQRDRIGCGLAKVGL